MNGYKIKCVVWDLDHTIWEGRLAENDALILNEAVVQVIHAIDQIGILQSIASRNDYAQALSQLKAFQLDHFFLYPQIHWGLKSVSLRKIAASMHIGLDTFAFIDDDPFEREEVQAHFPEVFCVDPKEVPLLLTLDRFKPIAVTEDARRRREMVQMDILRKEAEANFENENAPDAFLASLHMQLLIKQATLEDLQRAEELTIRTNQLNATGRTYSYEALFMLMHAPHYALLIAELTDKYGSYGKIGLLLIQRNKTGWHICILLISCRVLSRGVGTVLLNYVRMQAKAAHKQLTADFIPTGKNRMLYLTYKLNGFSDIKTSGDSILMLNDLSHVPDMPSYMQLHAAVTLFQD